MLPAILTEVDTSSAALLAHSWRSTSRKRRRLVAHDARLVPTRSRDVSESGRREHRADDPREASLVLRAPPRAHHVRPDDGFKHDPPRGSSSEPVGGCARMLLAPGCSRPRGGRRRTEDRHVTIRNEVDRVRQRANASSGAGPGLGRGDAHGALTRYSCNEWDDRAPRECKGRRRPARSASEGTTASRLAPERCGQGTPALRDESVRLQGTTSTGDRVERDHTDVRPDAP